MNQAMLPYVYNALAKDHFRVIEVLDTEPVLSVRLVDHPDNAPPAYHALSYAWGLESNTETIHCNGGSLGVTPHLADGLRAICRAPEYRTIWVDAICIDQESGGEKSEQVVKMHQIYRKARGVVVWLGKAEEGSDEAMEAIRNAQLRSGQYDGLSDDEALLKLLKIKSETPQIFDVATFKPLAALARRSWFRRLWVFQECYFAKSLDIFCGSKRLDGEHFVEVLRNLTINSFGATQPPELVEEDQLFAGFVAFREVIEIKKTQFGSKGKLSLLDFVVLGRSRFAKEPVDRIYAVFGMSEEWDNVYQRQLVVDYSDTAKAEYWRLYVEFGKIALLRESNLRLLSLASSLERPNELPSWCPNFHSPMRTQCMAEETNYRAGWPWPHHQQSGSGSCSNHANFRGNDANHVSLLTSSSTVSVWGASIGCISDVGVLREWDLDMYDDDIARVQPLAKALFQWLAINEAFCKAACKDDQKGLHVWHEVFVGAGNRKRRFPKPSGTSGGSDSSSPPRVDGSAIESSSDAQTSGATQGEPAEALADDPGEDKAYALMATVVAQLAEHGHDADWRAANPDILGKIQMLYVWLLFIEDNWRNRRLFATEAGHVGYGPDEVEAGHEVVALYGGPTIFVLQGPGPGSGYAFVGEAYVFECMDGEVFEMLDNGVAKEKCFLLS